MKITQAIKAEATLRIHNFFSDINADETLEPLNGQEYSNMIQCLLVAVPALFSPKTFNDAHVSAQRIGELATVLDHLATEDSGHSYNGMFGPGVVTMDILTPSTAVKRKFNDTLATDISAQFNLPLD